MKKANIKIAKKYFPRQAGERIDTAKQSTQYGRNDNVLMDAYAAWYALEDFRRQAERNEMYTFGNQLGDKIKDPNGTGYITEEQHIKSQGIVPLKNNRIRGIVRSVLGVFSSSQTEPVCISRDRDEQQLGEIMSTTIQYNYQLNKLWELDRRNLEYMLVSGVPIFKTIASWRNGKFDVWTDTVNYNRFFFDNHIKDSRMWDVHFCGEIHDIGLFDVMEMFSDGDKDKAQELRQIYSYVSKERTTSYLQTITENRIKDLNFFIPEDETRCRVIEIWKKEAKERIRVHDRLTGEYYKVEIEDEKSLIDNNRIRRIEQLQAGVAEADLRLLEYEWFVDNYWYFYFITPQGHVLKEGETPYWHDSHPYSFKIYPFYNGRVYPFVGDFIDQNKYINRLITMQDFIMKNSAKGLLMFPEESIPSNMTMDEVADEWTSFNGIIYYKAKELPAGHQPKQIITNSTQTGAYDMLQLQLKLLEDISGVHGALQGQTASSGTPASLYMQQVQNSATSLTDIFESYKDLREDRDTKLMKLIQQFYTNTRYINIVGKDTKTIVYDPTKVRNIEFDLAITESASTPALRMVMNDFLMQIFSAGQITLEELLQNGAFPFADKLLQSISSRKEQMQQGQPGQIMTPDLMNQMQQQ